VIVGYGTGGNGKGEIASGKEWGHMSLWWGQDRGGSKNCFKGGKFYGKTRQSTFKGVQKGV